MSRLTKLGLLLVCAIGVGSPSPSEAGVIPWMYDAMFGPVGSMQRTYYAPYSTAYAPYSAGYYGYSAGYLPAAYSYGPANGCSSCGCSPCGVSCAPNCAYGNCASGQCTTNLPASGPLGPTPDPTNYSRSIENRLDVIEKQLNIIPPRDPAPPREPRTYNDDGFGPAPPRNNLGPGSGSREDTSTPGTGTGTRRSGSGTTDDTGTFEVPSTRRNRDTTKDENDSELFKPNPPRPGAEGAASGSRESFKTATEGPDIGQPADVETVIPQRKPAPGSSVEDKKNGPTTLRMDTRITSKAVSPRERQIISAGFQKPVVAKSKPSAPTSNWAGNPRAPELARH